MLPILPFTEPEDLDRTRNQSSKNTMTSKTTMAGLEQDQEPVHKPPMDLNSTELDGEALSTMDFTVYLRGGRYTHRHKEMLYDSYRIAASNATAQTFLEDSFGIKSQTISLRMYGVYGAGLLAKLTAEKFQFFLDMKMSSRRPFKRADFTEWEPDPQIDDLMTAYERKPCMVALNRCRECLTHGPNLGS